MGAALPPAGAEVPSAEGARLHAGSDACDWGHCDGLKTHVRVRGVCPGDMTPMCAKDCLAAGMLGYLEETFDEEADIASVGFPTIGRSRRYNRVDAPFSIYIRLALSLGVAAKLAAVSGAATPQSPEPQRTGYLELPPPWGGPVLLDDWGLLPHEEADRLRMGEQPREPEVWSDGDAEPGDQGA